MVSIKSIHEEPIFSEKVEWHGHQDETQSDVSNNENETVHDDDTVLINAPWRFKAIALITALFLSIGSHFSATATSAMKSTLKTQLGIDNTKYGVLSSATTIIGTFLPVGGGMFIDAFGPVRATLIANSTIFTGCLLTALGAAHQSYPLMATGRVVFGMGNGLIIVMQETLFAKWFRSRQLSLAIGLQLATSQLSNFLGTIVSNPLAEATGNWVWPFWLALLLTGFSILMNVIYASVLYHVKRQQQGEKVEKTGPAKHTHRSFQWRSILSFPHLFWMIIAVEFIYAAVWTAFQTIATELVIVRFDASKVLAGYKASLVHLVPALASPFLGLLMDRFGGRILTLFISGLLLMLSCGLLGWTSVDAGVGMVLYSMSLAFGPLAMITAIGMVLPHQYIGTGLGLYKSANCTGSSILDIVVGVVQDKMGSYDGVMLLFEIITASGLVLIVAVWWVQRHAWLNVLECRRAVRLLRMEQLDRNVPPRLSWSYVYLLVSVSAIIVAWVLFFVYSASGRIAKG